jgi:hypothetical protein
MSIRCRPMRPKDVAGCVEIVAQHPFIGSRYAGILPELRSVWLRLLGREAFRAYVYEDLLDTPPRLVGVGCRAIISDEFLREVRNSSFLLDRCGIDASRQPWPFASALLQAGS